VILYKKEISLAKIKCSLCAKNRARRKCSAYGDKLICPACCAELRNSECENCLYFIEAKQHQRSNAPVKKEKHFMIELNEEVEEAVDKAMILAEKGKIEKARIILSDLIIQHPKNHMVLYGMGVVNALKGQHEDAIGWFSKATDVYPYFLEAHLNKAVAYQKLLDLKNAVQSFKEVIEIGPPENEYVRRAADVVSNLEQHLYITDHVTLDQYFKAQEIFETAYSHMRKKEWEKAISGFKECLRINPRNAQSHGNLGLCYAALGLKSEALAALDKAIEIDPEYEPAMINRIGIESLAEGEKLTMDETRSIEYYKDFRLKKKSYIQSVYDKIVWKRR
jgi:tetratricopeptide (TPR) repeat protein